MATQKVNFNDTDYDVVSGTDMSAEAQAEGVLFEAAGFEQDSSELDQFKQAAMRGDFSTEMDLQEGTFIAVQNVNDGKAALWWKYFNGGNPDTTRWFPITIPNP